MSSSVLSLEHQESEWAFPDVMYASGIFFKNLILHNYQQLHLAALLACNNKA